MVSCHTAVSKPVKQEVNGTVILPPFVFPALWDEMVLLRKFYGGGLLIKGTGFMANSTSKAKKIFVASKFSKNWHTFNLRDPVCL
jgi:hypothetical protein